MRVVQPSYTILTPIVTSTVMANIELPAIFDDIEVPRAA